MSEPQIPTSPTPEPPVKKKLSPLAWILIGCLGLLLVFALLFFTCSVFVAKQAKDFVDEASQNPAMAAAEMMVRVNPEIELIEKSEEDQTLTIRNRETGEVVTVALDEITEGRFKFQTEGKEVTIGATEGDEGGLVTITAEDGEQTVSIGSGSTDQLPSWLPDYPDADEVAPFLMTSAQGTQGTVSFETTDTVAEVQGFYLDSLEGDGFSVEKSSFTSGEIETIMLSATADDGRSAYVSVSREGPGPTRVGINFSEEK